MLTFRKKSLMNVCTTLIQYMLPVWSMKMLTHQNSRFYLKLLLLFIVTWSNFQLFSDYQISWARKVSTDTTNWLVKQDWHVLVGAGHRPLANCVHIHIIWGQAFECSLNILCVIYVSIISFKKKRCLCWLLEKKV
jgi:hypothetical protein